MGGRHFRISELISEHRRYGTELPLPVPLPPARPRTGGEEADCHLRTLPSPRPRASRVGPGLERGGGWGGVMEGSLRQIGGRCRLLHKCIAARIRRHVELSRPVRLPSCEASLALPAAPRIGTSRRRAASSPESLVLRESALAAPYHGPVSSSPRLVLKARRVGVQALSGPDDPHRRRELEWAMLNHRRKGRRGNRREHGWSLCPWSPAAASFWQAVAQQVWGALLP